MNLIQYTVVLLASLIALCSCNSGEESKQSKSSSQLDSSAQILLADSSIIYYHALHKLVTLGDFDGDGKIDTLFQYNYSLLHHTEIDSAADPFQNEWDTVVDWFYKQNPQLYLRLNKTNADTLKLGVGQGLYCLLNIGDNNQDGKDEVALVVDYLDYSRVNSCKIFSLCDNQWKLLKQFGIHEDAFNFNSEMNPHPSFPEINEYLEKHHGKWMYKDYIEEVTESSEDLGKMNPLIIEKCELDLKWHAQQFLNGTLAPIDDEIAFRILDSLFCKNKSDKDFYFKVANKIQQVSDGALSEYVSIIASKFYFEYNSEFIDRTKGMSQKDVYNWLDLAAFDIAGDSHEGLNGLPKIKGMLQKLVAANPTKKAIIEKYNAYLLQEIVEDIKIN